MKKLTILLSLVLLFLISSCENNEKQLFISLKEGKIKQYEILLDTTNNYFNLNTGKSYDKSYFMNNKDSMDFYYSDKYIISIDYYCLLDTISPIALKYIDFKAGLFSSTKVTFDYISRSSEIESIYKNASPVSFYYKNKQQKSGYGINLVNGIVFVGETKNKKKCIFYFNNNKLSIKTQL